MEMEMKSWEWEGMETVKIIPHTSSVKLNNADTARGATKKLKRGQVQVRS